MMCVQGGLDREAQTPEKPGQRPRGGVVTQRIANHPSPLIARPLPAHTGSRSRSISTGLDQFCTQVLGYRVRPEQIADRLMAPASTSALWTHDQVRRLLLAAAETAPMSTAERQDARSALRMVRHAMEELFGPVASLPGDDAILRKGPELHHEAEAIIAGLQRIAERLK